MINTPPNGREDDNDILERLRHPEREALRHKPSKSLFVRNILNAVFILIALVAMVGILVDGKGGHIMRWYAVGLFAVIIKMAEVLLRMPGMKNKLRRQ